MRQKRRRMPLKHAIINPSGGKTPAAIRPERVLALGFLVLIAAGTLLLSLPAASSSGKSIGLFRGLFTAASAVCVTGLSVVDTGSAFSMLGQSVLLVLIQLGGLGFMIFATLIMGLLGRRMTLRNRMLLRESMNAATLTGLVQLTRWYGLMALGVEGLGAALLAIRFVPAYGWGRGVFFSVFHAVSAFCNAGFDLFGGFRSLTPWRGDPLVLLTIAGLIVLGGLGFSVLLEAAAHRGRWRSLSLHAKLVLTVSAALLTAGTAFYAAVEGHKPAMMAGQPAGTRLMDAFFQSVSMRTAGFSTIELSGMSDAAKLFSVLLMFIGASPASTGGGVKTTTFAVLALIVLSVIRGHEHVNVFGRRLPTGLMRRALAILFISLALVLAGTLVLTLAEGGRVPFIDLLFEAASAAATVGVSAAGTPGLSRTSQAALIPLMYFGRVGPLTLALAFAGRQENGVDLLKYPEENMMIG